MTVHGCWPDKRTPRDDPVRLGVHEEAQSFYISPGIVPSGNLAGCCPTPFFYQVRKHTLWDQAVQRNREIREAIGPAWHAGSSKSLHEIFGEVIAIPLQNVVPCALVRVPPHALNDPLYLALGEFSLPGYQRRPVNILLLLGTDTGARLPGH